MNKKILNRKNGISLLKALCLMLFAFVINIGILASCNFGYTNLAEYAATNIEIAQKDVNTGLVGFELSLNENKGNYFLQNRTVVTYQSELERGSSFFVYKKGGVIWDYNGTPTANISIYGAASTGEIYSTYLGMKIKYGQFVRHDFNTSKTMDPQYLGYCIISDSYASLLVGPNDSKESLIGQKLICENNGVTLTIRAICADDITCNYYSLLPEYFIMTNYLNCSTKFDNETFVMQMNSNFEHDYKLLKEIFCSTNWTNPLSKNTLVTPTFQNNAWLMNEMKSIYSGATDSYKFAAIIIPFLYLIIGILMKFFFSEQIEKHYVLSALIMLFIYTALVFLASPIVNHLSLFGLHLVGLPVFSLLMEAVGVVFIVVGYLFSSIFRKDEDE